MHFIEELTELVFLEDMPEVSDIIFIPGGSYGAIARTAARLYKAGYAPRLLPSGKYGKLRGYFPGPADGDISLSGPPKNAAASGKLSTGPDHRAVAPQHNGATAYPTEWEFLRSVLWREGVPESAILKEDQATYTYENAIYSRQVTDALGLEINKAIICCQAYHARRCRLYYEILYPNTRFFICPTVTQGISRENWYKDPQKIDTVLGEIERWGSQFHDILREYGPSWTDHL